MYVVVGCFGVVVCDAGIWEEEGEVLLVYSSCKVDIFWVHKESFVEESDLLQGIGSHEHEASAKVWNIHDMVVS